MKYYTITDVTRAEVTLAPIICVNCHSAHNVEFFQSVNDAFCVECGEWQEDILERVRRQAVVVIHNFDEGIRYVNRLGFTERPGVPGWIPAAQKRMADTEAALFKAAGKEYPFKVKYSRKHKIFQVHRKDRSVHIVDAKEL